MNISDVQNTYLYNAQNILSKSSSSSVYPSGGTRLSDNSKDKVTLSAEGMKASENASLKDYEKFRMPSWLSQYYPKQTDLSISGQAVEETRQLFQMQDKFHADGYITGNEQQRLNSFRSNNMTANQTMRDNLEFISKYNSELMEYGKKIDSYYAEAKEEQGITQRNYNERVLQAEGDNKRLHQHFREKLLADPSVLELMDILGVQRPS